MSPFGLAAAVPPTVHRHAGGFADTGRQRLLDRQSQLDLLETRIAARLRSMRIALAPDVITALAHDVLNDALQVALEWLEPEAHAHAR